MKKRYLIFLALFVTLTATAQSSSGKKIIAQVTDNSDVPIPYATVALYANDRLMEGTESDTYGFFELEIKEGQRIEISSIGYEKTQLSYYEAKERDLINLKPTFYELATVVVTEYRDPIKHNWVCSCVTLRESSLMGLQIGDFHSSPNLTYYPNPTKDNVIVETMSQEGFILVFSANGTQLMRKPITNDKMELDLADLPDGTYFLSLQDNTGVKAIGKIIKSGQ